MNEFEFEAPPCIPSQKVAAMSTVTLSPNPAVDHIKIFLNENLHGTLATLYDLSGRAVRKVQVKPDEQPVMNLTGLRPGLYLLHFDQGQVIRLQVTLE